MADDITANVVVGMPSQLFTASRSFKALANGRIYLGKIDTDPTNPINQIQVYIENEDSTLTPIAQPVIINAAGFPVHNGQVVKIVTTQGHSMAVFDAYGAQEFYFPNVLKYDPDQVWPEFQAKISSPLGYNYIGSCRSMANVSGLIGQVDGQRIQVEAYHADSNKLAGGWFYWDASASKTLHNGVTVFDPNKKYPTDWNNRSQRLDWYTPSAFGNGVWRRELKSSAIHADMAGCKPYNSSAIDTESINALVSTISTSAELSTIRLGEGVYRAAIKPFGGIVGEGYGTKIVPDSETSSIIIEIAHQTTVGLGWSWRLIENLHLDGETADRAGITLISYPITVNTDTAKLGRYIFRNIVLSNANVGIRKPGGNIGAKYENVATNNLNYGVWATSYVALPMHSGNDTYDKCHFTKCYLAATRYDSNIIAGSELDIVFRQVIFEYNAGWASRIRSTNSEAEHYGAVHYDNCWFEGNGGVGTTVNIDGVDEQPGDIYLQYIRRASVKGSQLGIVKLVASTLCMDGGGITDVRGSSFYSYDADLASTTISYNDCVQFGRPLDRYIVQSVASPNKSSRPGFLASHRTGVARMSIATPDGYNVTFDGSTAIPAVSHPSLLSTQQADSMLGTYSARWAIPAGQLTILTQPNNMVMTPGRFYVWTVAVRWISGDATVQIANAGGATLSQPLSKGTEFGWRTFGGIAKYVSSGDNRIALRVNGDGTMTTNIQFDHFQIVSFASIAEALNWYNSGVCLSK